MASSRKTNLGLVTALAFVSGLVAGTVFLVVVFDDSVQEAAVRSLGHAAGSALGVFLAYRFDVLS